MDTEYFFLCPKCCKMTIATGSGDMTDMVKCHECGGEYKAYYTADVSSCFHLYVTQIDFESLGKSRAQVMKELRDKGIGTQVHYIPVPTQPYYKNTFGYKDGDYPVAEKYYEQELSLPLYPGLSDDDVDTVIKAVKEVVG